MHCFPGSLGEMRAHASSGNMRPPACVGSADGAHNSCPQVLHSQVRIAGPRPLIFSIEYLESDSNKHCVCTLAWHCNVGGMLSMQVVHALNMPCCPAVLLRAAFCACCRAGARGWGAQRAAVWRALQPFTLGQSAAQKAATSRRCPQHAEPIGWCSGWGSHKSGAASGHGSCSGRGLLANARRAAAAGQLQPS